MSGAKPMLKRQRFPATTSKSMLDAGNRTLGAANRIIIMSRNTLYIIIAIVAVGGAILGYMYYQDQQTSGVEIKIGEGGISIEEK
jgi:hypothetical protein